MTPCRRCRWSQNICACLDISIRLVVGQATELTLKLEGEVIGQMPTFVVTTQEEQCIGVPDLERPQVKHALPVSL